MFVSPVWELYIFIIADLVIDHAYAVMWNEFENMVHWLHGAIYTKKTSI
jgi:hypothetical protein